MVEKRRDYRFDNLKGLLILLMVFAHVIEQRGFIQNSDMPLGAGIYAVIFSFHMPAFIFISGYFSRRTERSGDYPAKLMKSLLLPFLVFQLLTWLAFDRAPGSLFEPVWTKWYLLSLFFWRLMAQPMSRLRHPILVTTALAILAGFTPVDTQLSASRTVCFFPFFMLGYGFTEARLDALRRVNKAVPAAATLAMLAAVILMNVKGIDTAYVSMMHRPYDVIGLAPLTGAALRMAMMLMAAVVTLGLAALAPERRTVLSALGRYSMTVYLFHSYVIEIYLRVFNRLSFNPVSVNEFAFLAAALAMSVLICLAFGNPLVSRLYAAATDRLARFALVPMDSKRTGRK